jgi:ribosomal protein S18 acetylase RimI-like enzyme
MTASSLVQPLDPTPLAVAQVRAVFGAAFADDPMQHWIFEGVEAQEHAIAMWIGLFVDAFAAVGTIDVALGDEGEVVAAAMWRTDGRRQPYPELPSIGGMMTALLGSARAAEVGAGLAAFAANKPEPPYHYLNFLGVHPSHQGRGLGRQLVAAGQARAAAAGQSIYLESTNSANLPFYGAMGFQRIGEFTLQPAGPPAFRMWWAS